MLLGSEGCSASRTGKLRLALQAAKKETWDWEIETGTVSWSDGIEAMFGWSASVRREGRGRGEIPFYIAAGSGVNEVVFQFV